MAESRTGLSRRKFKDHPGADEKSATRRGNLTKTFGNMNKHSSALTHRRASFRNITGDDDGKTT